MLVSLGVPAFAESTSELKTDAETGELYEEFTFDFGGNGDIITVGGKNFDITTNKYFKNEVCGGGKNVFTNITAKKTDLYITRVEARVTYGANYSKVCVTIGQRREKNDFYNGIVHVDNINSPSFEFSHGSEWVSFDLIRVYYKEDHMWSNDGKCKLCGEICAHDNGFTDGRCNICRVESDPKPEKCEVFENFNFGNWGPNATVETDNFILETLYHPMNGVFGGSEYYYVKIKAKNDKVHEIQRIEARVSQSRRDYEGVGVTAGEKREKSCNYDGQIVHIDDINSNEFSFAGGYNYVTFDMIKVYYKDTHVHNWENGICSICNVKGCEIGELEHDWENGICSLCNVKGCEIGKLKHAYSEGVCSVCNVKGCEIGELEHDWNNGVCSVCECECEHTYDDKGKCTNCKMECPHTHITQICDECGVKIENDPHTASTISEGNMTIIVGVACLAVGLVGGLLIGKKKKVTE